MKFGIALIVIAVLIYIFYPREDAIVIDLPIPYVYYNQFKEALNILHVTDDSYIEDLSSALTLQLKNYEKLWIKLNE